MINIVSHNHDMRMFLRNYFEEHVHWLGQEVIKFVHHQLQPKPTKQTTSSHKILFVWLLVSISSLAFCWPLPDDEDHLQTTLGPETRDGSHSFTQYCLAGRGEAPHILGAQYWMAASECRATNIYILCRSGQAIRVTYIPALLSSANTLLGSSLEPD